MGTKGNWIKISIIAQNTGDVITKVPLQFLAVPEQRRFILALKNSFPVRFSNNV